MQDMKVSPPTLLPLLRSRAHGELMAWLYLHPEAEYSTVEMARLVGISQATVSREADRLLDAGLDEVYDAARTAGARLGREVNPSLVSAARWAEPGDDPFLTGLRQRPLVQLGVEKD
jgi:hypothetical protein